MFGVLDVCDTFLPLLEERGRIVNISSASGPKFVSECSSDRQRFFSDASVERAILLELIHDVLRTHGDPDAFAALGLGLPNAYGFSKASVSLYTLILARENPALTINACTPGYIETDLTRPVAQSRGMSPGDLGMKAPSHGTIAPMRLLFDQTIGSGHYYGSDALRSPLHCYRAPGSPEYLGD